MTAAPYDPARRPNPAAAERALYYAGRYGSADAALAVVDVPGHNDAFDRTVNEELRQLRKIEQAARFSPTAAARLAQGIAA